MNTFLKVFLFILILLSGLAGLGIYWTFFRPLPDYNETISAEGLQNEVQIHWDNSGIPHIYADNKQDLYFALGYVHAQDRLWQMTLTQLASEGRLAEFLGKELVSADIFQRTIGFWRTAGTIEEQLADSTLHVLQAYADGVNSFTATHPKELPVEFSLTGMDPLPWKVRHSIALARLMAWELNIAWKNELTFAYLDEKISSDKLQELLPDNPLLSSSLPNNYGMDGETLVKLLRSDKNLRKLLGMQGFHIGSNAWAVHSSKTETDFPLLAGDPHLELNMPGKWYEVHLNLNGNNLSGATLAGAPIVILGQNDFLGWSLTNIMADDTDFFVEAVHPDNPNRYVLDTLAGQPVYGKFEIQKELLKVKGESDSVFTRKLTKHGPVISDIYPDRKLVEDRVVTMRWTGHQVSHEVDALLGINWARSFEEFRSYLPLFRVPGQNIVYADRSGNIALFSLGAIPLREGSPVTFRRGWKPEDDWQGYVPFEQMPRIINPSSDWVANANNPVQARNRDYYISMYWEPDSRYDRIRQYLSGEELLSTEVFQAMQNDSYSHYAREMTELVLPILKNSDRNFAEAVQYLENWDYRYQPSETAASIMETFTLQLGRNIFTDEFGEEAYSNFITFSGLPSRIILRFMRENSSFFDDVSTDAIETRSDIVTRSMEQALDFLNSEFGSEPFEWRWENLHTLTLDPLLFEEAARQPDAGTALKLIVNNLMRKGPYAASGHSMSINNGEYDWSEPYEMRLGASIRRIVDFSDLSKTLSITPTGQSGNILSEYYGDQTESWLNGQYKYLYQDSSMFRETIFKTMRLKPE